MRLPALVAALALVVGAAGCGETPRQREMHARIMERQAALHCQITGEGCR